MSVFKKYNGKRINAKHPAYAAARWWVYRRVKGHKTIHQVIPTARTKEEAELAERQLVKQLFDRSFGLTDTTVTFGDFVETTYRKYVDQNNVNKGAKKLYIELLLKHLKDQPLHSITPQDCRDCRNKLQYGKNQRKKKSSISPSSINRIMSTLSKIFSLACEESKGPVIDGTNQSTPDLQPGKLQAALKTELFELSLANADPKFVQERTNMILDDHLSLVGARSANNDVRQLLTSELSSIVNQFNDKELSKDRFPFSTRSVSAGVRSRDDHFQTTSERVR